MSNLVYNESSIKLNVVKQKIISSLLVYNYELVAICYARLFTGNASSKNWLYTELEGGLTLVIDFARKSAGFKLFDLNTFEIIFECEFYKNFNLFYTSLTETLQCFEVSKGFIGFSIPDKNSAQNFFKSVSKLTDSLIAKKIKEKNIPNKNDMKSNSSKVLSVLKEKLASEYFFKDNVLNEKKLELDLNNIENIINMIEYDYQNAKFLITGNVKEIDELVGKVKSVKYSDKNGLKVTDTVAYAMEIYQSLKNSMVKNKEINEKKARELAEEKRKNNLIETIKREVDGVGDFRDTKANKNVPEVPKGIPQVPVKGVPPVPNFPTVPTVPKGVPPIPKGVPPVPKGIPPVPGGIPPVPKGIPAVPKVVSAVPTTQISQTSHTSNVPIQTVQNSNTSNIQNTNTDESLVSEANINIQPVEEKKPPVKRKEPKMDMMTELKMRLANRGNPNANPIPSNANAIKQPESNTITNNIGLHANITNNNTVISENNTSTINFSETKIIPEAVKSNKNTPTNPITNPEPKVQPRNSNIDIMREALNKKFGGASSNQTPIIKENIKPSEMTISENNKQTVTIAPSSNVAKMNINKMIEQMEKSYMGGATETKEEPQAPTTNKITEVEKKPTIKQAPVVPIPSAPSKGNIPKVPGVPVPPPLNIPLPPKINMAAIPAPQKAKAPELTLMEQVSKGVQLKKCETVEKTGLDYIKSQQSLLKDSETETKPEAKIEVKNDLFAEMRKVQLKKVNK